MSNVLVVVGPTAAGKSRIALHVARKLKTAEIVSVDSMQVYRYMDVGTAKATRMERKEIAHHLIDVVDPDKTFSVTMFQHKARMVLQQIAERGNTAILVGGTGLYYNAVVDDFSFPGQFPDVRAKIERTESTLELYALLREHDELAASRIEPDNRRRIVRALEVVLGTGKAFSSFGPGVSELMHEKRDRFLRIGLGMESAELAERINARVRWMFDRGLIDEVRFLNSRFTLSPTARQAIGYKEVLDELDRADDDEVRSRLIETIQARTRKFARRQRSWFRRDDRITWFDPTKIDESEFVESVVHAVHEGKVKLGE